MSVSGSGVITINALSLGRYGNASAAYELTTTFGAGVDFLLALKGRAVAELNYTDEADLLSGDVDTDILPMFRQAMTKVGG